MEVINVFVIYEMINKIFLINYLYDFILTRMKILAFLTPTESCGGFKTLIKQHNNPKIYRCSRDQQ